MRDINISQSCMTSGHWPHWEENIIGRKGFSVIFYITDLLKYCTVLSKHIAIPSLSWKWPITAIRSSSSPPTWPAHHRPAHHGGDKGNGLVSAYTTASFQTCPCPPGCLVNKQVGLPALTKEPPSAHLRAVTTEKALQIFVRCFRNIFWGLLENSAHSVTLECQGCADLNCQKCQIYFSQARTLDAAAKITTNPNEQWKNSNGSVCPTIISLGDIETHSVSHICVIVSLTI